MNPGDEVYLDDLLVECGEIDQDLDGIPADQDCDDTDPWHWSDCGLCIDMDFDGFGPGCDLGPDCNDSEPDAFPGNPEVDGDGIDQDCDGFDSTTVLFDDFELGIADPLVWDTLTGTSIGVVDTESHGGDHSLNLDGGTTATTWTLDHVELRHPGVEGPRPAVAGPPPRPATICSCPTTTGPRPTSTCCRSRGGPATTGSCGTTARSSIWRPTRPPSACSSTNDSLSTGFDDYYVDDFGVGCSDPDLDGDGRPGAVDCAPLDPDHWSDCGTCTDLDADSYGLGCDLGPDCDEADATTHVGAPDPVGDGIDQDCSGVDGPGLFDDFEDGTTDPSIWSEMEPEFTYDTVEVYAGNYSLRMEGQRHGHLAAPRSVELLLDRLVVCRTARTRDAGELRRPVPALLGRGRLGAVRRVLGDGTSDPGFEVRSGEIVDAAALSADLQIQVESSMGTFGDEVFIDDLSVVCGLGDGDGDGVDGALDCDDADPAHWRDCGACVDLDGDDYGLDCDLGPDCDDGDAGINPRSPICTATGSTSTATASTARPWPTTSSWASPIHWCGTA